MERNWFRRDILTPFESNQRYVTLNSSGFVQKVWPLENTLQVVLYKVMSFAHKKIRQNRAEKFKANGVL